MGETVRGALDPSKRQDEDEPYWLRDWGHSAHLHAGDWERHPPRLLGGASDLTDRELGSQAMEGWLSGCCQDLSALRDLPYSSHTSRSVRCLDIQLCPVSIWTVNVLVLSFCKELCWADKMAQWLKTFAMQTLQPMFNPQNPHKGGRQEPTSQLSSVIHMHVTACPQLCTCTHTIINTIFKKAMVQF